MEARKISITYFGAIIGTIIQFGCMLFVYSLITSTEFNIIIFIIVGVVFGLIFAPMHLLLNKND